MLQKMILSKKYLQKLIFEILDEYSVLLESAAIFCHHRRDVIVIPGIF